MGSTTIAAALNNHPAATQSTGSSWQWLYKLGGAAALVSVIIIPITIAVYFVWPPPDTVAGHFAQFQKNWLVGLLGMRTK